MTDDLETLWHSYHKEMYAFIFLKVRDRDLTDDLVSVVYLRALVAMNNGNGYHTNARGWMYTIARTAVYDYWKSKRSHATDSWEELADMPSCHSTPQREAELGIVRHRMRHEIAGLTEKQEDVMNLHLEGCGHVEAGEALGVSRFAAQQLYFRSCANLRKQLADLTPFIHEEAA